MARPSKFNGRTVAVRIPERALPLVMLLCEAVDAYSEPEKLVAYNRRWLKFLYYSICLFASKVGVSYEIPIGVAWKPESHIGAFDSVYRIVSSREGPWSLGLDAPVGVIWVDPNDVHTFTIPQIADEFCTKLMEEGGDADA